MSGKVEDRIGSLGEGTTQMSTEKKTLDDGGNLAKYVSE